ncbi:hypothetical protein PPL_09606 [Heterostelium album PN500]|uniref:Uncharacterized protein n=1 Tax=Heterostelium pallidum (strain ATCC 26659 / Pp 5 / PN500) TaxID=670386 RepID=D3BNT5_HETP5|nr:hypothetical protein PPL_09606 [Heterostelium album PN500]EFA76854.1 hypothetical protein PPL_09606 [Heterostelium album PN500]|eukprot:XP_020428986.1 hypothetical protein PPL_09606 [Heterostelium album PN500]
MRSSCGKCVIILKNTVAVVNSQCDDPFYKQHPQEYDRENEMGWVDILNKEISRYGSQKRKKRLYSIEGVYDSS